MDRILYYILCLIGVVFISNKTYSQGKTNLPNFDNKYLFEANLFYGKIYKHNSKFIPKVTEYSFGFEVNASYKTFGNKNWHRALNYPEIGISYIETHFGDKKIFGNEYGFMSTANFNIFRSKYIELNARLGAGLGYITTKFHPDTNPTNNVIGSKINSLIQYKMGFNFHVTSQIDLVLAGALTHFSNSGIQVPNLGINIPTINIGAIYKPKKYKKEYNKETQSQLEVFKDRRKNEFAVKLSLGVKDREVWGPKYPIYSGALQYARYFGYANKVVAGTILAFDQYEYDFFKEREIGIDENQTLLAMDYSIYSGYEMMLGNVGINFLVGAYLMDRGFVGAPIWTKPGVTYYFTEFGALKHRPFVGVNIKTHFFIAQYVEIHTGIAF